MNFADLRLFAMLPMVPPMSITLMTAKRKITISRKHFVHIALDADGNAESDCADVKVEKREFN